MSDTATPKRNEAVAKVRSDLALAVEVLRNVGGQSAIANTVEAGAQAIDALQGEVSRLRADAMRYRYLRRKACFTGNGDGTCSMQIINLPVRVIGWPEPEGIEPFIDAAIDNELTNLEPPTDGR